TSQNRRSDIFKIMPSEKRCKFCRAPFDGYGGTFVKNILHIFPSRYNPHYCNTCDNFAKKYQGGAEVPLTILFADMRGSTTLAENMDPREYSKLVNKFYIESSRILNNEGAMIEKLAGDEVTAVFSAGQSGEDYTRVAVEAAKKLLRETGHGGDGEPWVSIGIGIHSGVSFIGSIGRPSGIMEVTTLGDVPNIGSRLTGEAKAGEIMVSEVALNEAGIDSTDLDKHELSLKGRSEKVTAYTIRL
ncbi:MAG: adenylate/guanylate cyclase domain-containing protein, partial [Chloroflexota bacterium]